MSNVFIPISEITNTGFAKPNSKKTPIRLITQNTDLSKTNNESLPLELKGLPETVNALKR